MPSELERELCSEVKAAEEERDDALKRVAFLEAEIEKAKGLLMDSAVAKVRVRELEACIGMFLDLNDKAHCRAPNKQVLHFGSWKIAFRDARKLLDRPVPK